MAENDRGQGIPGGLGFDIAKIGPIGLMQIDDSSQIIDGTDAFLIFMSESDELHRRNSPAETTWCDSSPMAGVEQRIVEPILTGTGFCSRSPAIAMLAPMASQSPGLMPRVDQRAMICSTVKT